jgi:uncharacterized protein YkwD
MTPKRVWVSLLVATLAAFSVIGALSLVPQGAQASLLTVKTCGGGTIEVNANEKRILELHNEARTKRGLKALCVHLSLTAAARAHSQDMLNKDYASHDSPDGEGVRERLKKFSYSPGGYSYYSIGENIAWGCESRGRPEHLFKWWMHSRGHRANILNNRFREVGIGARTGTFKSCDQASMYTVDFGTRRP